MPVEAWTVTEHILTHVSVAVAPDEPAAITPKEIKEFRRLAARANAQPWVAAVVLAPDIDLVQLDWSPMEGRESSA